MAKLQITYIEIPTADVPANKQFYGSAFGWSFEDFGPQYSAFHEAGVEGGFNGTTDGRSSAPLVILQTDDLRAVEAR